MMKIDNPKRIQARVRFINGTRYTDVAHASVSVTFEQKDTRYGLGSDHPLDSFEIRALLCLPQISGTPSYGWTVQYKDIHKVELSDAVKMADFLNWLNKSMEKHEKVYGRPLSFGQYVVRILGILGVDVALVQTDINDIQCIIYGYGKMGELTYPIDSRINEKNADWNSARGWLNL